MTVDSAIIGDEHVYIWEIYGFFFLTRRNYGVL
jgi:hypothetical protein